MVSELWCGTYVASLFGHILQVLDWFGIWGVWVLGQCNGLSNVFPEVLLRCYLVVFAVWCGALSCWGSAVTSGKNLFESANVAATE